MPHVVVVEDQHETLVVQDPRFRRRARRGLELLGEEVDGAATHQGHQEEVEHGDRSETFRLVPIFTTQAVVELVPDVVVDVEHHVDHEDDQQVS